MTYTEDWRAGWRGWCCEDGPDASLEGVQLPAAYQAGYNAAALSNEQGGNRPEAYEAVDESIHTGHWARAVSNSRNPMAVTLPDVWDMIDAVGDAHEQQVLDDAETHERNQS